MTFNAILHFVAAGCCVGLAGFALFRAPRSFVHRIFAAGMAVLALEAVLTGLSLQPVFPEGVLFWQRWRFGAAALLPGIWLLFSFGFPGGFYSPIPTRWKWFVLSVFVFHLAMVSVLASFFFQGLPLFDTSRGWLLPLGWAGLAFHISFILSLVLILMLLERTLRSAVGIKRWQIKFLLLGVGGLFATRLYTVSQVLLFGTLNLQFEAINGSALIIADLLIVISMLRTHVMQMDIYLSGTILYRSATVLVVGLYFLVVGVLAKLMSSLEIALPFPLGTFFIFLAFLVLLAILLSDDLRLKLKAFISRHFKRPQYDYRKAWTEFTQRTSSIIEASDLCNEVAKMVSDTLHIPSVSIWYLDQSKENLKLGGSTSLSEKQVLGLPGFKEGAADLVRFMGKQEGIVDLESSNNSEAREINQMHFDFLRDVRASYCVPLATNGNLLGLITFDNRLEREDFSTEELALVNTIAEQVAGSLLNRRLSESLRQAKELEAFQSVAAFFVHDLKNLASKLSVLLQNIPIHFENPEFREDALGVMSHCVTKLNGMCSKLFLLKEELELQPAEADLNQIVRITLEEFNDVSNSSIIVDLEPIPKLFLDPEQIQKVLTNLVLNANDAVNDGGEIRVITDKRDDWVELSVSDNGCGMPREFIENDLFRPFKTTKKQGMGIGLFHSKIIVEAHKGRIEVESEEGVGSTFRVLLPIQEGQDARH